MKDTEGLIVENENLKKIIKDRSDFFSITAHKLRTSLTALKWTLRMFLNKDLGNISDEQKKYLEKLIENNEKSLLLINDMLISNRENNNSSVKLNVTNINIIELVEKIIFIFYGELKNKNINLILNKDENSKLQVKCDEEMIIGVFENLIENAIKYSPNGGEIKISIKKDEKSNGVLISIQDNGIGIKEEDTSKIFSKFFRAPNAIEKENTGSGLGLFTTKSYVDKNNGSIWFESVKGEGTTFFVLLPTD